MERNLRKTRDKLYVNNMRNGQNASERERVRSRCSACAWSWLQQGFSPAL